MSHFVKIKTRIKDQNALIRALERMGFKGRIEVYAEPQNLYGYMGDVRVQKAHIILRRKYLDGVSNDIGFEKMPGGFFIAHISEFDDGRSYGETWRKRLFTYYGVERAKIEFEKENIEYVEDEDEKGRPRLTACNL